MLREFGTIQSKNSKVYFINMLKSENNIMNRITKTLCFAGISLTGIYLLHNTLVQDKPVQEKSASAEDTEQGKKRKRLPTRIGSPLDGGGMGEDPNSREYATDLGKIAEEGQKTGDFDTYQSLGVETLVYKLANDPGRFQPELGNYAARNDIFRLGYLEHIKSTVERILPLKNRLIGLSSKNPLTTTMKCNGIEVFLDNIDAAGDYSQTPEVNSLIDYARESSVQCSEGTFDDGEDHLVGRLPLLTPWAKGDYAE